MGKVNSAIASRAGDREEGASGFTLKEAAALAEEHLGGARVRGLRPLSGGRRNQNYRLATDAGFACVLRVFDRTDRAKWEEESIALAHLERHAPELPVPRVLGRGVWGEGGEPYLLLSLLPGRPVGRGLPSLDGAAQAKASFAMGDFLARLHATPLPAPGYGLWCEGAERQADPVAFERDGFERASRRCVREGWLTERLAASAVRFLERRLRAFDPTEPAVFCHHDLHADNVLFTSDGEELRLSGVVDFEHARGRSREYDWVMALWSLPDDGTAADYGELGPLRRAFLDGYARLHGLHAAWRERLLAFEMIKAVGFLVYKPAYAEFLTRNREHVVRLLRLDGLVA